MQRLAASCQSAAPTIGATAVVLLTASAFDIQLGLPTAVAGAATALVVLIRERKGLWLIVKDISWGVLPLVAGLFVLVEALDKTGLIGVITALLHDAAQRSAIWTAWGSGIVVAGASNLANNLLTGLVAGDAVGFGRGTRRSTSRSHFNLAIKEKKVATTIDSRRETVSLIGSGPVERKKLIALGYLVADVADDKGPAFDAAAEAYLSDKLAEESVAAV